MVDVGGIDVGINCICIEFIGNFYLLDDICDLIIVLCIGEYFCLVDIV